MLPFYPCFTFVSPPMLYPLATGYETNVQRPLIIILTPNCPVRLYNIRSKGSRGASTPSNFEGVLILLLSLFMLSNHATGYETNVYKPLNIILTPTGLLGCII